MRISNDHVGSGFSVIDTADLVRALGGVREDGGGPGGVLPPYPAPPPPRGQIVPNWHCPPGTSPNYLRIKTPGTEYERFRCDPVQR
jgi:hypothetical protein